MTRRAVYFTGLQKENLIKKHMGMINKIVSKFYHNFKGMDDINYSVKDDMVQEGILGFLKALEKYDPEKGVKISSFAYFFIFSAVQQFVAGNFGVCRQPHDKISNDYKVFGDDTSELIPERYLTYDIDYDNTLDGQYGDLYSKLEVLPMIERECLMYTYGLRKNLDPRLMPLTEFLTNTAIIRLKAIYDNIEV